MMPNLRCGKSLASQQKSSSLPDRSQVYPAAEPVARTIPHHSPASPGRPRGCAMNRGDVAVDAYVAWWAGAGAAHRPPGEKNRKNLDRMAVTALADLGRAASGSGRKTGQGRHERVARGMGSRGGEGEGWTMDGTRARRTRDRAGQGWYAQQRQRRFARFLGFGVGEPPRSLPALSREATSHRR